MASKPLQLKFVQSATRVHQLPELGPEVAFVGRSNVGKSSLINALAHQRQLARVSNTPGRTQLINVFSHVAGGAVVDLPGYGYAKVPGHIRGDWSSMIEGYLLEREELVMVFVLVDGEIGPTPLDVQMLEWLRYNDVPHTVVATKSDKVKSAKRQRRKRDLAEGCMLEQGDIVWVSASKNVGIERLRDLVISHLTT
ncbi:MAG: ribosome biogenesis GTP-binding protein YihA/YsxC [Acidimicrobiaceae bacterium]|jgi:GTP-binding protein|nr:ribosome biogenesis GTP-binding protein YihA/YsxC [Actinomycetota bacterium]MEC7175539.1 ribosome biogenesis GTP-binding protein YihA/YsxC [Actinomycetota bacterium]MEC7383524.1 ribosome biogenesis GTP-binding protein YihA/YsxC [Actinomycetota bacterium]MEC7666567.1 ribosome biogenesis GTP-binding protein YihA/YsxC [Actinomycetota bacterium]MEC8017646.1 ribosome biogenesis GTP-binding protein YihA/YsxC [Actinomycetota bacterium]